MPSAIMLISSTLLTLGNAHASIVVPLQQRVQKLESQIERLHDAIEEINSCPYRAECPVLGRMRQHEAGD